MAMIVIAFQQCGYAQCPVAPKNCTKNITGNANQGILLQARDTLCVSSGAVFSGAVQKLDTTSLVYIYSGAVFRPSSVDSFKGKIVNCGEMDMPSFNIDFDSTTIENYGLAHFTGTIGTNNPSKWRNGVNADMIFDNSMTLNSVHFANYGSVSVKGSLTVNSGMNVISNYDSMMVDGSANINAKILNEGVIYSKNGTFNVNASGPCSNACYFVSGSDFTYSGSDTLFVSGVVLTQATSAAEVKLQGKALVVSSEGLIEGVGFHNNSTPVLGAGNFIFTGMTVNQGPFGNDKQGLNFYDTTPTGSQVFDLQSVKPDASVTKKPIAPVSNSYVPSLCSSIFKSHSIVTSTTWSAIDEGDFSVFPNPCTGNVLYFRKISLDAHSVLLRDLNGNKIANVPMEEGKAQLEISLTKGMYLFEMQDDQGKSLENGKVIVQ